MLCYNGYSTPNLNGYSPYELVFGHKMTLSQELELKVDTVVSGTFTDYYEKLKKILKYMGDRLQKFRSQRLDMLNRNRQSHAFEIGQMSICTKLEVAWYRLEAEIKLVSL